jgi:hypothetical protein
LVDKIKKDHANRCPGALVKETKKKKILFGK